MSKSLQFPTPGNFPDRDVLYTDGDVAVAIGTYKNSKHKSIGVRWTESESPLGYPSNRGYGMWVVLPDKLALYIIEGIYRDIETEKKSVPSMDKLAETLIYIRGRYRY